MNKCVHIIISLILILIIVTSTFIVEARDRNTQYVSSKYSKYCYCKGEESKNIKYKVYYKSLEECGKTFKK